MKKIYFKLIAITLTLVLSVSVVAMSSYAWLVLSGNPMATGIQVTIGGGNTILIAPDMTETVDGVVYHYPGPFMDNMNFSRYASYSYLQEVQGLVPVSTADGVHFFLPAYYDFSDEEVRQGTKLSGELKDVSEFLLDSELTYANLTGEESAMTEKGSYVYLDFWVVSPGGDFTLRLSTGDDSEGSFLVDLPMPQKADVFNDYTMADPEHRGAAAVRVGFLANDINLRDDTMLHYQNSNYFRSSVISLRGMYAEPNSGTANLSANRFTIYEPNADHHPYGAAQEGEYLQTRPLGLVNEQITPVDVSSILTVQRSCTWIGAFNGTGTELEQRFQAALFSMKTENMNLQQIGKEFYGKYLQWQLSPYVTHGKFLKDSADLKKFGEIIGADQFAGLDSAGATEDVYIIKLERNIPQRIRMFIWLEGQDADCVNAVNTAMLALNLELAGSSEEEQ